MTLPAIPPSAPAAAVLKQKGLGLYPGNRFFKGAMPKWNAAKKRGASAPPRVIIQGHSNVAGAGAGTGSSNTGMIGARALSWPVVMAKNLGWQTGSVFGTANASASSVTYPQYDPRVSMGSFIMSPFLTFGTAFFTCQGASTTDWSFTPESAFDKFTIWFPVATTGSSSNAIKVDGVVVGNLNQQGAGNTFNSATFTTTLGTHTISIQNLDTTTSRYCFIAGVETRNSASAAPILIHGSKCGGVMSDLNVTTSTWSWLNCIAALTPDVVMTQCLINDVNASTTITTLQPIIDNINLTAFNAGADVVNTIEWPWSNAAVWNGTMNTFADYMENNSVGLGGSFADCRGTFGGTFTIASSRNLVFDTAHPNAAGHALEATLFAPIFQ